MGIGKKRRDKGVGRIERSMQRALTRLEAEAEKGTFF